MHPNHVTAGVGRVVAAGNVRNLIAEAPLACLREESEHDPQIAFDRMLPRICFATQLASKRSFSSLGRRVWFSRAHAVPVAQVCRASYSRAGPGPVYLRNGKVRQRLR